MIDLTHFTGKYVTVEDCIESLQVIIRALEKTQEKAQPHVNEVTSLVISDLLQAVAHLHELDS